MPIEYKFHKKIIVTLSLVILLSSCASREIVSINYNADTKYYKLDNSLISKVHVAKQNENLILIAKKYLIDIKSIIRANPKYSVAVSLPKGARILIPATNLKPNGDLYYKTSAGDTIANLARHFQIAVNSLLKVNNLTKKDGLRINQIIKIPLSHRDNLDYVWPVLNPKLNDSGFFRDLNLQSGLLLNTNAGVSVYAIDAGKVIFTDRMRGLGKVVIIEHNKRQSVYAFCEDFAVKVGESVKKGQKIAIVGFQTRTAKYGIYFELRQNHTKLAPENYLPVIKNNSH